MNGYLGVPSDTTWQATRPDFARFVRLFAKTGLKEGMNGHFQASTRVTDGSAFSFEYYLKLEDMAQWLPCMADVRPSPLRPCLFAVQNMFRGLGVNPDACC